jgi:hypothetical protein
MNYAVRGILDMLRRWSRCIRVFVASRGVVLLFRKGLTRKMTRARGRKAMRGRRGWRGRREKMKARKLWMWTRLHQLAMNRLSTMTDFN